MRMTETELEDLLNRGNIKIHGEPDSAFTKRKKQKGKSKDEFQSLAEKRYYEQYIQPMVLAGLVDRWSMHESFVVEEGFVYQGIRFRDKIYSPDFMIYFKDGSVTAVEVKGDQIRKLQREYPLKKQLFIRKFCIPNNWAFKEIRAADLTGGK